MVASGLPFPDCNLYRPSFSFVAQRKVGCSVPSVPRVASCLDLRRGETIQNEVLPIRVQNHPPNNSNLDARTKVPHTHKTKYQWRTYIVVVDWQMKSSPRKLRISLRENGLHSFRRGMKSYGKYLRSQDPMLLKDAVMFLHHGIELLMKQILVQHSEYLIFDDLDDASEKQRRADDLGISVFDLEKSPLTVGYNEAIHRVEAFVKHAQLDETLRPNLENLNRLRNKLEHYAINADRNEIEKLLSVIRDPLLDLFDTEIGGIKRAMPPAVNRVWDSIRSSASKGLLLQKDVSALLNLFKGQTVEGRLLNQPDRLVLPTFTEIRQDYRMPESSRVVDIWAEGEKERWAVEIKTYDSQKDFQFLSEMLFQLAYFGRKDNTTAVWLVVSGEIAPPIRSAARGAEVAGMGGKVLVSGRRELQELKHAIDTSNAEET